MRIFIKHLLLTVVLTFSCTTFASAASSGRGNDSTRKHGIVLAQDDAPKATLTEGNSLARICSSRPERILPSFLTTNSQRHNIRHNNLFNLQKASFCQYRGLKAIISRRILAMPSCEYYILTLRHLLC